MILECIYHAASFDLGWFVSLFMNNLLWVFIFFCCAVFLGKEKGLFAAISLFIFFVYDMFTEFSFSDMSGWAFSGAQFLIIYYVTRLFVGIISENNKFLKNHVLKIFAIHWLLVFAGYNLLLGGF